MRETIIQFGEGNFLRGFIDDFINTLNLSGLYDGKVVIVKPTPRGNLENFESQNCIYNLIIRGNENGKRVSETRKINSVSRCINPYTEYEEYMALAKSPDFRFIISNTTEAGIVYDESCKLDDKPAISFPAKLTQLLFARYKANLNGFVILPCELIDKNADELKRCVLKHAESWGLESGFTDWLNTQNAFCNTLVDRIVTGYPKDEAEELCGQIGYDDKLLDTAEPYHLWAIEGDFESELPLKKAGLNVIWTNDISPLKKRKVRLLNGAHTVMVFPALLCGINTVEECLNDRDISAFLSRFLNGYALEILGKSGENEKFANDVLERFSNPFIKHRLTSIALNSVSKFSVRVLPTAVEYESEFGVFPKCASFSLASLIYYYKNRTPEDDAALIIFIRESSLDEIVKSDIWGYDISKTLADVKEAYEFIENDKIREGLLWAIS